VQEQEEDLGDNTSVGNLLIAKMCDEGGGRQADGFVVTAKSLSKLHDQSIQQQFSDLRQLGVHDRYHSSIDGREGQGRGLCFHDTPAEQTSTTNQVLTEQLRHDVFDVGNIDLVDEAIYGFLECFPCHTLVLFACLVGDLRL